MGARDGFVIGLTLTSVSDPKSSDNADKAAHYPRGSSHRLYLWNAYGLFICISAGSLPSSQ